MQSQIVVNPELSEKLSSLAQAQGITVDELLAHFLSDTKTIAVHTDPSAEEFERNLDALVVETDAPLPENDGSYRREDIYLEHN